MGQVKEILGSFLPKQLKIFLRVLKKENFECSFFTD